jgi:hypothetical protein
MSLRLSQGARDKILNGKGFRRVFEDSTLRIYTGTQPASSNSGATGSLLVSITKASGTVTVRSEKQISLCKVSTAGSAADTHVLTVNGTAYTYTVVGGDTADIIAKALAKLVNEDSEVVAVAAGGTTVTESAIIMQSRTAGDSFTAVASNTGAAVLSVVEDWVAATSGNGLRLLESSGGAITKTADVWSGLAVLTGTAGWFRLSEFADVPGNDSTTLARLDGSVGTSGADLIVGSSAIQINSTFTIDTATFTMPTSLT